MGAEPSEPSPQLAEWFRPDTYSVWAYDREGEGGKPIFLVLYEWEIASLCGVHLCGAWGNLSDVAKVEDEWDTDYQVLHREVSEPVQMGSLGLAQLIQEGHLQRIGSMPRMEGFTEPAVRGGLVADLPAV